MGSIERRRASVERPSSRSASKWFGTIARVRANQKPDRPVSTRPLSGISVGSTTSKVEIRSLATSSRRSSSSSKISRTLPLAMCTAASGMNGFLLPAGECSQAIEQDVDVAERLSQVEGVGKRACVEARGDLGIRLEERAEVELLVPGSKRASLHEHVRLLAGEPGGDQG